ncbi:mitogen-activated protein kinase kinase kinase SSK1 NDAI_0I02000 [Naumovozyma dairenensis CBS 421]|uniref:Response regulatory domain-containing protein n=1 Tax=Naumovozyma dairenensis (strain ATCC 10597 / BCRC 20456 / CBS 421 / NBRC 0211 / NRRL Y-12639) TaxID=1071378 RepID=G0WG58_NAUDC|nr:hypothetical protein NDAI_0I02000 [Naumovozyma dairenensis CBS 421]CCD26769.1 hypothetical protein NDAI_0I02000 [Naumovozyma dairenensis CBS 421]
MSNPLPGMKNPLLNSALLRKIWLQLDIDDDHNGIINEPFSIEFNDYDTIDDLKTKIFLKLNSARWTKVHDNPSIAIGHYENIQQEESSFASSKTSPDDKDYPINNIIKNGPEHEHDRENGNEKPQELELQIPITNKTHIINSNSGKSPLYQPGPIRCSPLLSAHDELPTHINNNNNDISLQRAKSSSPHILSSGNLQIPRFNSASPYTLHKKINNKFRHSTRRHKSHCYPQHNHNPYNHHNYYQRSNYNSLQPHSYSYSYSHSHIRSGTFSHPYSYSPTNNTNLHQVQNSNFRTIPFNNNSNRVTPTSSSINENNDNSNENNFTAKDADKDIDDDKTETRTTINVTSSDTSILNPCNVICHSPLNYTIELMDNSIYRIIFEPDELVTNIYHELFQSLGAQTSRNPLLVFSSPALQEQAEEALNSSVGGNLHDNIEQQQIHVDVPEEQPQVKQQPTVTDYELITNEEQLRRVSEGRTYNETVSNNNNSNNNDAITPNGNDHDRNMDMPKQAILLLPKNYYNEDGTFKEEQLKRSILNDSGIDINISDKEGQSELQLPLQYKSNHMIETESQPETDLTNTSQQQQQQKQQHPLIEQEIGLLHPMLENEWRKNNIPFSPMSPSLKVQTPNLSSFPSISMVTTNPTFTYSISSISHDTLLSGITTTSEKVFPKINVLIVEDNVINQAILGSFLRKHKISYKVAKNGKEAVDIWKEGGLHLIFMDLQLPVLSGIEAARQIRDFEKEKGIGIQENNLKQKIIPASNINQAPVIIVALTASNSLDDKRKALLSGCNDYLTKPVNLHWLSKKITEWGCMQALIDFDSWKQGTSVDKTTATATTTTTATATATQTNNSKKLNDGERSKSSNKIHHRHRHRHCHRSRHQLSILGLMIDRS